MNIEYVEKIHNEPHLLKREGVESDGEMRVLGKGGDTKFYWDSENKKEVEEAEKTFKRLIESGWSAFRETKKGDKGEKIKEFDKCVERIIFIPPIEGG